MLPHGYFWTTLEAKFMYDCVQVKAVIPRELKRQTFVALAAREQKFSHWLRAQLEIWLQDINEIEREEEDERRREG